MSEPETGLREARRRLWLGGLVAASAVVSAWWAGVHPGALLDPRGLASAGAVLGGFAHPDLSAGFLHRVAGLALESVLIAVLSMAVALVIGVSLALVAARTPTLRDEPGVRGVGRRVRYATRSMARGVLALLRSVPEIVWAFLFVRIIGLGPGPAVLAIGLTFGGILGKLYAELIEAVDPGPARRLRAAGAGRVAVFLYGVFPLVRAQWIGYALLRLECAIRSASILGVVGAGGLGYEIDLSLRYFEYDKLATTLLAVLAYVVVLELASGGLRRRRARWTWALIAAGAAYALVHLSLPFAQLASSSARAQAVGFVSAFLHPNIDPHFVWNALALALETVAMAWCATLGAAIIAMTLAPLAARTFTATGFLPHPPGRHVVSPAGVLLLAAARLLLQLTRAIPELVWALVFVLWVGPGVTAGALAIGVHSIGILGRLYGEVLEEAEPEYPRALEAAGATRLARFLHGALPQVAPRLLAFTLFRFEVNIRLTAMVGFVGAGGLGDALHTSISLFHVADMATLILVLLATVLVADALGDRVRRRLLARR